eukprot:COSAG04_NODE_2809_length_3547_cov_2.186775_2_plen_143_part_00
MIMRSDYNNALVQAVEYTGEATTLSWELQHSLCAAAGRATPGSDLSGRSSYYNTEARIAHDLDKFCAYSASDNHVVADRCWWYFQEFTRVSGSLGGGVGYMCAGNTDNGIDCFFQVRVEGSAAAAHEGHPTLNSGDAVFCSP